ncbi:MAG: DNA repair protein RecN, partial [Flavobacteriaceae bacterium]|nr:DNA repair protein RecN [Flavobacteriaceae bacterium]
ELDYEPETLLRREIIPSGKSRAFINDTPVTLDKLNRLSEFLIDVHSQHENQSLFKSEYQFLVLDALANNDELLNKYRKHLNKFNQMLHEYNELTSRIDKVKQDNDYSQFLFDELATEELNPDIWSTLVEDIDQLSSVEDLQLFLSQSIQIIEEDQMGLLSQLSILKTALKNAANKSKSLAVFYERVASLDIEIKDVMSELINKLDFLESNPSLLEKLNNKMNKIQGLFQKHQVDNVFELILIRDKLEKKLQETLNIDNTIEVLKNKLKESDHKLNSLSSQLHKKRETAIPVLCCEMEKIISKMGMKDARFKVKLTPSDNFLNYGKEQIEFLFSANLGANFKPIKKVASGGEMSRIMLSIKSILSRFKQLPTIVFDEIDTGVSGSTSNEIGNIMQQMSNYMQVFTITHLPQVAAKGKQHYRVYKEVNGPSIQTKIKDMNQEERVAELAQMLSGKDLTQTAFDHARQLLN